MKFAITGLMLLFFISTAQAEIHFSGGNGESAAQAVQILGAQGEVDGVRSEYEWVAKRNPGCKRVSQALTSHNDQQIDQLNYNCSGTIRVFYFDITALFGKF